MGGYDLTDAQVENAFLSGNFQGITQLGAEEVLATSADRATRLSRTRELGNVADNNTTRTNVDPNRVSRDTNRDVSEGGATLSSNGYDLLDQADLDRLTEIRNDLNITSKTQLKRNVAVGEGHIDGVDIGEVIGISGKRAPGVDMPENRIFKTTVDGHPRDLDSEVFVLENIAQRLNPNSKGTIRLLSERAVCNSCEGVIKQFKEKFPNVKLVIRAGSN